jgi:hypothetical protein
MFSDCFEVEFVWVSFSVGLHTFCCIEEIRISHLRLKRICSEANFAAKSIKEILSDKQQDFAVGSPKKKINKGKIKVEHKDLVLLGLNSACESEVNLGLHVFTTLSKLVVLYTKKKSFI